jgi:DNA-binding LytR/AlgR family response regulator
MDRRDRDAGNLMRIVIIEDEAVVARRIERMAHRILGAKLERVDVAAGLGAAVELLARVEDAAVLLDLNLAGEDGFEVLRRAAAEPFQTIVISANTDRAVEAFELGIVDFVAKPFTEERLAKAFARLASSDRVEGRAPAFLAVTLAGRVDLVAIESVVAIHGADDYSELETADGRRHLHKKTLTALESLLPPHFQRVHRSHIVNLRLARELGTDGSGRRSLKLANGSCVPVSRVYAAQLRKAGMIV